MLTATSKLTVQGQISVPAKVRRDLGLKAGSELLWERLEDGSYRVRPKRKTLEDLHRLVGEPAVRLSDEELMEARRSFQDSRLKHAAKRAR